MGERAKTYSVWTTNNPAQWDVMQFETDNRDEAYDAASRYVESKKFRFVAIDKRGRTDRRPRTVWTNDPDTDTVSETSIY